MKEIVITFFVNHQHFGSSLTGKIGSIACFGACAAGKSANVLITVSAPEQLWLSAFSTNG